VSGDNERFLIKDEPPSTVDLFSHNGAANFKRTKERPPFVDHKKGPNDQRFGLFDNYDKSTYLTKNKRTKSNVKFQA
jgi:hypothetical protein